MLAVRVIGWVYVAIAAFAALAGVVEEEVWLVAAGASAAVAGVLFLALDRGLELLAQIRDRLASPPTHAMQLVPTEEPGLTAAPTKTIAELDAAIAKARAK